MIDFLLLLRIMLIGVLGFESVLRFFRCLKFLVVILGDLFERLFFFSLFFNFWNWFVSRVDFGLLGVFFILLFFWFLIFLFLEVVLVFFCFLFGRSVCWVFVFFGVGVVFFEDRLSLSLVFWFLFKLFFLFLFSSFDVNDFGRVVFRKFFIFFRFFVRVRCLLFGTVGKGFLSFFSVGILSRLFMEELDFLGVLFLKEDLDNRFRLFFVVFSLFCLDFWNLILFCNVLRNGDFGGLGLSFIIS